MADQDAAFLWETEALRTPATPPAARQPSSTISGEDQARDLHVSGQDWLTLRQASAATGIPIATLRKWASKGRIPSILDETPTGSRRLVTLDGVRARAAQVGRESVPAESPPGTAEARGVVTPKPAEMTPPPGTMIVPIAAWDKMLLQLGNLHEAGQQLAEARERAARAETEAVFLRERLAEMRAAGERSIEATQRGEATASVVDEFHAEQETIPSFTAYLWRSALSGLRRKK
jgi:hypothetical protein